jgi:hypothetical protein
VFDERFRRFELARKRLVTGFRFAVTGRFAVEAQIGAVRLDDDV